MLIPKKLYPAVMFAKKMIREGQAPGLSIWKAAQYYGVETSEVAEWMNKKHKEKPPQKWFFALIYSMCEATNEPNLVEMRLGQTNSRWKEKRKIERETWNKTRQNDTGSVYSLYFFSYMCDKLYDTKEQAKSAANDLKTEIDAEWELRPETIEHKIDLDNLENKLLNLIKTGDVKK